MHGEPDWTKIMVIEKQYPDISNIKAEGFILDIGGGGEGIIGQQLGDQVISIDRRKDELEEAKNTNLKIIMDATDLQFLDESFNTAASFFTFMYINQDIREKVMSEIHRVLKPGGRLLFWDVVLPSGSDDPKHEMFMVPITVTLHNGKEISTGYGSPFKRHQIADDYKKLAKKVGFKLTNETTKDQIFYLEFIK
ncbi:MAG: class I SAM-dependent methyltransferase [Candidatus Heimdallarchaeota archaeon]